MVHLSTDVYELKGLIKAWRTSRHEQCIPFSMSSAYLLERTDEILVLQIQNYPQKAQGHWSLLSVKYEHFSETTASFQTARKPSYSFTESQSLTKLTAISMIQECWRKRQLASHMAPSQFVRRSLNAKTMALKWFMLKDQDPKHHSSWT
jgi:hypothetical protein